MKRFIECRIFEDKSKVAIAVDKIISIAENFNSDNCTFIQVYGDKKAVKGFVVVETYAEVMAKIEKAGE